GIRDKLVTGVQTCALPISYAARDERALRTGIAANGVALMLFAFVPLMLGLAARALHPSLADPQLALATVLSTNVPFAVGALALRSEERRVGKECRPAGWHE